MSAKWSQSDRLGPQSVSRSRHRVFQTLVLLLITIYPVFGQIVPTRVGLPAFLLGILLLFYGYLGSRGWSRLGMGAAGMAWVFLALFALVSNLLLTRTFDLVVVAFAAAITGMLMASTAGGWSQRAMNVLTGLLLVHASATLMFYFSPGLFDSIIRPRLFQDARTVLDYRTSLTSNSGYNAMYCSLGFLLVAVRLFAGEMRPWKRRGLWVLGAVFLFALILTAKRAHPLYAILTVTLLYLMSHTSGKWVKVLAGATVGTVVLSWVAGASAGVANSLDRFLQTFEAADAGEATSGRTFLWGEALTGWLQAPFAGNGWGSFYVVWPNGRTESFIAHNQVLNLLYESGLIGTFLFVIAAVLSLTTAFSTMKAQIKEDGDSQLLVAATASSALQLFMLVYAVTGGELLSKPYTFVPYFLAVAMGFSARRRTAQHSSSQRLAAMEAQGFRMQTSSSSLQPQPERPR